MKYIKKRVMFYNFYTDVLYTGYNYRIGSLLPSRASLLSSASLASRSGLVLNSSSLRAFSILLNLR